MRILSKGIDSGYLLCAIPPTVLCWSFWNFTGVFVLVWRCACGFDIQATPAMSTSRISILSLMSKWFFIPNIFSLYIFAFQLRLCRKRLTWSNGYLEVIFHTLDVFSIILATAFVEVKTQRILYFGYVHVLPEVRKPSKQQPKQLKWYTFFRLSI